MDKEYLKHVIVDQREARDAKFRKEKFIQREGLSEGIRFLKNPNIVLITGMRRCGKSIFSNQIAFHHDYASINFDDERLIGFTVNHFDMLLEAFFELYGEYEFVLFDEIQNISGWELFINRIRDDHKIIITGSNAQLLSSELATHLTGRFDTLTLFPMSWKEYVRYSGFEFNPLKTLSTKQKSRIIMLCEQFVRCGGIFEYYSLGKEHIRTLFGSIIHKDIFGRYALSHSNVVEELAMLLVASYSSKISIQKLAAHLQVKSGHTIKEYLGYLENTYLLFTVGKWSYKLRQQQSAAKKVYITDTGIIDALSFDFSANKGRLLENAVAIELVRRGLRESSKVYYWDDYRNECDFIVKKGHAFIAAVQVCAELTENNLAREKNGLLRAMEEFKLREGLIVTASQSGKETVEGKIITTVPFYRWAYRV